ncbi:glycosyltransferase family 9 protein [Psychromonas sp. PT13]|uniref:glycosyltransferase family 9 protein n=1 Tax=Psychromonas sp. PT13 TaxID=3439547 RepID=UPI003EBE39BA
MKILIIHTFGLGDMVMLTPSLVKLKKIFPNVQLDFVALQKFALAPIVGSGYINNIYYFEGSIKDNLKLLIQLRKTKYDYILHSSGTSVLKMSLLFLFLNGKNKIGEFAQVRIPWYTKQIKKNDDVHRVESNLHLITLINECNADVSPFFYLKHENIAYANNFIAPYQNKLLVGIHPGCNEKFANKRWELEKYLKLICLLQKKFKNIIFFIFIGPDERDVGNEIKSKSPNVTIVDSKLDNTAAVISKMTLFLTNDSGLGHIASCFDVNILTIFSKMSHAMPNKIYPYSKKSHIINFQKKSEDNEVNLVFNKMVNILNNNN